MSSYVESSTARSSLGSLTAHSYAGSSTAHSSKGSSTAYSYMGSSTAHSYDGVLDSALPEGGLLGLVLPGPGGEDMDHEV